MTQPNNSTPMRTIGIDLGDRESSYCVLSQDGTIIEQGSVQNTPEAFEQQFARSPHGRAVLEASCQSQWVSRCLSEQGHEVITANPRTETTAAPNDSPHEVESNTESRLTSTTSRRSTWTPGTSPRG